MRFRAWSLAVLAMLACETIECASAASPDLRLAVDSCVVFLPGETGNALDAVVWPRHAPPYVAPAKSRGSGYYEVPGIVMSGEVVVYGIDAWRVAISRALVCSGAHRMIPLGAVSVEATFPDGRPVHAAEVLGCGNREYLFSDSVVTRYVPLPCDLEVRCGTLVSRARVRDDVVGISLVLDDPSCAAWEAEYAQP
jgi:hypothetical protein